MLTLIDTLAVIVSKVESVLSNCSVSSQDIAEGFERNTMYIYFDGIRQNDYMKKFVEKKVKIVMIYFPTNERKNTAELLEVQDKIMNLFTTGEKMEYSQMLMIFIHLGMRERCSLNATHISLKNMTKLNMSSWKN